MTNGILYTNSRHPVSQTKVCKNGRDLIVDRARQEGERNKNASSTDKLKSKLKTFEIQKESPRKN